MADINTESGQELSILNIGTKILIKDVMDQYLRSLGGVKTFYASKLEFALETLKKQRPQIVFCEQEFMDGTALDIVHEMGGLSPSADRYFVLAVESSEKSVLSLVEELGIDELLVRPFSIADLQKIVERYRTKVKLLQGPWVQELRMARNSLDSKRFKEAEEIYGRALNRYPNNMSVVVEVAEYYLSSGVGDKALDLAESILQEQENNLRASQIKGASLVLLGKNREALNTFLQLDEQSPLNWRRKMEIANLYLGFAKSTLDVALRIELASSELIMAHLRLLLAKRDYVTLIALLSKQHQKLTEKDRKEAEYFALACKKIVGLK